MSSQRYTSPDSHDVVEIEHGTSLDRCRLKLIQVDQVEGQISLVKEILPELQERGYQLMGLTSRHKFFLPEGSTCYRDMTYLHGNLVYCDLEHFEEFFRKNLKFLINPTLLHLPPQEESEDGWVTVCNPKKRRTQKLNQIKQEIAILCGDWESMSFEEMVQTE